MSFKRYLTGLMMALSIVVSAASVFAADIVGLDTTAVANWRTAANLDSNGDTEYGSDGYIVYGLNQADNVYDSSYTVAEGATFDQSHLPAYITGITRGASGMWSGNGNFGQMQDPDNGNALTSVPLLANGADPHTYTIQRTAGSGFRLTILVASGDGNNVTHVTTCQDSVDMETQSAAHTANGLHYHVYDVEAGSGDVTVTVNDLNQTHLATGFAFDPLPSVPGALTLSSATVTNITSTNALGGVVLGGTNAFVTLYWGSNNAAKTFAWETTNDTLASSLQSTGSLNNVVISNLTVDTQYYYIFYASNNVGAATNWSALNQSFGSALTGKSVTNLDAAAFNATEIELTWTDNFNTETGYLIQRSPDGASWTNLTTTATGASNHLDVGLSELSTYHYRIAATNDAGLSDWSSPDQATTPARTNRIDTAFTEATFGDIGILRDIPDPDLASITLDDANDRLVFATTGNTDMWTTRNNAPIGYILKPDGPLWFMEAEIELATANNTQVFGFTVYDDIDGAKGDFTYGLDYWNPGNPMVKFQGLGDNNPDINTSAAGTTRVILRMEVEDDGGGPGIARYRMKYDLLLGGGMQTLGMYDSNVNNARVGVMIKTAAARTGYVHSLEIDSVPPGQPVLMDATVTNITATTALGGVTLAGTNANLTLFWGESDEVVSITWDETNALPVEQSVGQINGVSISNLTADTQYYYIFYASNSVSGLTNWSDLNQTFDSALTGKSVTNLSASPLYPGQIELSWTDNFSVETGYVIQRSPDGSSWAALATIAAGASSYLDGSALPENTYHYRIAATNAHSLSDWSATAQATALALPDGLITSDLIQDLDAEKGVALDAGTNVTAWTNQAAGGGDDVVTSVGSPQLVSGITTSGLDAIEFTSDKMNGDDNSAFDTLLMGNGCTWFIVAKVPDQTGNAHRFFGTLQNFSPFDGVMAGVSNAEEPYSSARSGTDVLVTAVTNLNDGSFHIIAGRLAAGTGSVLQEVFVHNATAAASGNVTVDGVDDCDALAVGSERTGGTEYIDASIARILIYNRPLSNAELSHNLSELNARYLTLPTDKGTTIILR
ncbi:MAG: fibronectin type III domain-containing protein [SAR202 cluster bacterium]|nr:fibronectin type III domain-containing protein [SAR202 cluster bacterium]